MGMPPSWHPPSLIRTKVLPLHLYISDGSVLRNVTFLSRMHNGSILELSPLFHLDHNPINHMVRIMYIFLKQRNMENIVSFSVSMQCKSICNYGLILSRTSNGPQYLGANLAQLPSFKELFLGFTLRKT
jgi:hypothetical protein